MTFLNNVKLLVLYGCISLTMTSSHFYNLVSSTQHLLCAGVILELLKPKTFKLKQLQRVSLLCIRSGLTVAHGWIHPCLLSGFYQHVNRSQS